MKDYGARALDEGVLYPGQEMSKRNLLSQKLVVRRKIAVSNSVNHLLI